MRVDEIIISGQFCRGPEFEHPDDLQTWCRFSLLVTDKKTQATEIFECVAWRKNVQKIRLAARKNIAVLIYGALHRRDKNGRCRVGGVLTIEVAVVSFLGKAINHQSVADNSPGIRKGTDLSPPLFCG
jgi:hypothetical protein